MTAGGGEGGVSHLRSVAFIGGEGVQGLEVDRKDQSKLILHYLLAVTAGQKYLRYIYIIILQ